MIRFDYASPVDVLTLIADDAALCAVYFENNKHGAPPDDAKRGTNKVIDETRRQLDAYFAGKRKSFDLPLAPRGTPFQLKVWQALRGIPYGLTRSYGQIAAEVGAPQASRAVGAANGRNPIPVIVPCHRVIGANGSLTGFGGGMERKRFLLQLEQSDALILSA
ncbi:MAG: methylated-DNA--[protein]-cysteine S-methyltransferase [Pseudomonadota bacterium]